MKEVLDIELNQGLEEVSLGIDIKSRKISIPSSVKEIRKLYNIDTILFENYKVKLKSFKFKNEFDINYSFKITNVSGYDINKLLAVVEFYDKKGQKLYTYKNNLTKKNSSLSATADPLNVNFTIRTKKNLVQQVNELELKLYLTKNEKVLSQLYSVENIDVTKVKIVKK